MVVRASRHAILIATIVACAGVLVWSFSGHSSIEPVNLPVDSSTNGVASGVGNARTTPNAEVRDDGERTAREGMDPDRTVMFIAGRVFDADKDPLANAIVGDVRAETPRTTDDGGRFELVVPKEQSDVTLLVLANGHAPSLLRHDLTAAGGAGRAEEIDVHLQRGGRIRGRVDRLGRPIAGATVTLMPFATSSWPATVDAGRLWPPIVTGADGTYVFEHLVPGPYRVEAVAAETQRRKTSVLRVMDGEEVIADPIVLEQGFSIRGRVIGPDDEPVLGAAVEFRCSEPRFFATVTSLEDGSFAIDALPPGPLGVRAFRDGFLEVQHERIDPQVKTDLVLRLASGLSIKGRVVDARSGEPVESFAVYARALGTIAPEKNGTLSQQLTRTMRTLRESLATVDPAERERQSRLLTELEARQLRVAELSESRPRVAPSELGEPTTHAGGRFLLEGLQEGIYAVCVASPEHAYAEIEPVELQRTRPAPVVRVEVVPGLRLAGMLTTAHDPQGIEGATIELRRVFEPPRDELDRRRSLYPWVFAKSGPLGVVEQRVRTQQGGRFEFLQCRPGRVALSVRDDRLADHETAPFTVSASRDDLHVIAGERAVLTGRVIDTAHGEEIEVVVLGGHGVLRTVHAKRDGTYRVEGLQPGPYLVRAYPGRTRVHVNRLFGSLFPLHAGGVDEDAIPQRDVELRSGETRTFDVAVARYGTGSLRVEIRVNGVAVRGARAVLRPLPGEAKGSGGLASYGYADSAGMAPIADVPEGKYTLHVYGMGWHELHREVVSIERGRTLSRRFDLTGAGVRGSVRAPDANSEDLRGTLWILPGATEGPDDVYVYRREARVHRVPIRKGVFEQDGLTCGPALVIVQLDGRERVVRTATLRAGQTLDLELDAPVKR
ncbi:MAG: carboxypeptidase regulatory-like domain-containing protein [Planctomycetes bacterium]|nr:carboxypeptidase regulatory-like domain-containing protein [Planctomycetota bacterium]